MTADDLHENGRGATGAAAQNGKTGGPEGRDGAPGDQAVCGVAGAGQRSTDTGQKHAETGKATGLKLVERATALRGLSISRPQKPKNSRRRQTQADINSRDAEIPYVKFETAVRDLVCSLMERQDRMNEAIFYKLNDLEYRVDDLEQDLRPEDEDGEGQQ